MKLFQQNTPLEKAIKKMNAKDFRKIVEKIEKEHDKKLLNEITIVITFEIKKITGEKEKEGITIVEKYKK